MEMKVNKSFNKSNYLHLITNKYKKKELIQTQKIKIH